MRFSGKTDIGNQRRNNQDSYAMGELPEGVLWAVVCDGMGGANGGNVASSTAVETISNQISASWRTGMSANSIRNLLQSAVAAANINIFDMSQSDSSLAGMGTTVVAVIIDGDTAYIVHAGDSRAYLLSKDNISQVTVDHSIVQDMIEMGSITEEEARIHPKKNVITKALGVDERIDPEFTDIELDHDDKILLCTDGLTNFVDFEEIKSIVSTVPFSDQPKELINAANRNGGGDNITVVIISH